MSETRDVEEFRAYYYSLYGTGESAIDGVLRAVARAGKAYHNTSGWTDEPYGDPDGPSEVEKIQAAANEAAAEIRRLRSERNKWRAEHESAARSHMEAEAELERRDAALRAANELRQRVALQNGTAEVGDGEWDAFDREAERNDSKVKWGRGADFGDPVVVVMEGGKDFPSTEEHGYLTCLPGDTDCDTDGVIHLPHTHGDKDDGGPVWLTIADMAALPDVLEIRIGDRALAPVADQTGEPEPCTTEYDNGGTCVICWESPCRSATTEPEEAE